MPLIILERHEHERSHRQTFRLRIYACRPARQLKDKRKSDKLRQVEDGRRPKTLPTRFWRYVTSQSLGITGRVTASYETSASFLLGAIILCGFKDGVLFGSPSAFLGLWSRYFLSSCIMHGVTFYLTVRDIPERLRCTQDRSSASFDILPLLRVKRRHWEIGHTRELLLHRYVFSVNISVDCQHERLEARVDLPRVLVVTFRYSNRSSRGRKMPHLSTTGD